LNIYSANFIKLYQHNLQALYKWQNFSLGSGYFNKQRENDSELMEFKGDRITKLKGNFSYSKDNKVSATLHWQQEVNDSLSTTWKQKEKANTYGISSYWNTSNHQFDVDISRRTTQQESYDMAEIRVSNSFWQQALDSDFTYSLQNVEFYPKQRELVYVGEEYGLYDSTGTYSDDGEYIWEVTDIDYDNPQLSVEVNANFNLYFKPAQLTKGFAKRFETETNVIVTENSKADDKTSIYFLNPNALMKKGSTLYGKNSLFQNVWIDIWHRRLTAKLGFQYDKILDNRYQSEQISRYNQWEASLRSRMIKDNDVELSYFYTEEEDSYYHSRIDKNEIQLDIRSNLPSSLVLTTEMSYDKEVGSSNLGEGSYNIKSWDISENLTYFGSNRYRIFGRLLYRKNWRSGSGFLGYLPEKREGNIWNWKFNFNYKINKFTSTSLEYNGDSYPNQDTKHEIQVELKAEF
ncbi:MAG: hypothetical protein SVM86_05050, partial [Candidatus Cloacimonadota bacterium]|nr:hypothetical protein [Candidatus Cloacimonadota bacterium]